MLELEKTLLLLSVLNPQQYMYSLHQYMTGVEFSRNGEKVEDVHVGMLQLHYICSNSVSAAIFIMPLHTGRAVLVCTVV